MSIEIGSSKNNGSGDPKRRRKRLRSWKKVEKMQFKRGEEEEEVLHLQIYLSFGDPKSVHFPYITA